MTPDQFRNAYDRDSKMWAIMVSELADTKTLLNAILSLLRIQLEMSGMSPQEAAALVDKHVAEYRKEMQEYSKKLLALEVVSPPE